MGGVGIGVHHEALGLEAMMAFAVVGNLDAACLSRVDGLTGKFAGGAAATLVNAGDNQRGIASVGEMEGIGNHLALKDRAEVVLGFVELDDGAFLVGLLGRLGVGDQIRRQLIAILSLATHGKDGHGK